MMLSITKMHTLGNDFVLVDLDQCPPADPAWMGRLADRHLGVGCDQILGFSALEGTPDVYQYRIFNADGGEVGQCGNGALCLSRYLMDQHPKLKRLTLQTLTREMVAEQDTAGLQWVHIGQPSFESADWSTRISAVTPLPVAPDALAAVDVGNPHVVLDGLAVLADQLDAVPPHHAALRDALQGLDMVRLGRALNEHPGFPDGVNVSVMLPKPALPGDRQRSVMLRVYERGVGETMACGSAACAAAAVALQGVPSPSHLAVHMPGGCLQVAQREHGLWLNGPTQRVFQARYLV